MAENSKIEWCDHTFNPWVGCTKISPACDHCYAEGWAKRTGGAALWQGERRRTSVANWRQPLIWNRKAASDGVRRKVFCASLADVFDNQVPNDWRADLWRLIRETPSLDWLLLTKRPQNITGMLPGPGWWGDGWPNVWLGTTAEDQHHYAQRWHHLAAVPAKVRFLSYEPALGPLGGLDLGGVGTPDWIICGGESGPHARAMHPDWARGLRDQCAAAGVPFHFKQWGEWAPLASGIGGTFTCKKTDERGFLRRDGHRATQREAERSDDGSVAQLWRVGKKAAGRLLDGREWSERPTDG